MTSGATLRLARARAARLLLTLVVAIVASAPARGQACAGLCAGPVLEKNSSWQPGVAVAFRPASFASGHLRLSAAYTTTRLATALGSNDLVKDRLAVGAAWQFRPARRLDPYAELQVGRARYALDDPELFALLDNDAIFVTVGGGIEWSLLNRRAALRAGAALAPATSSTVYPLVLASALHVALGGRAGR